MKRHLVLVAAALFVLAALPASAQQLWGTAGSVGIIDESSVNLYEFSGQSLQFRPGAVGTIVARYPIVSDIQNPNWGSMWMGYAGAGFTARIVEVQECGITETTVATFNNPNTPEANICISDVFGPYTWNFAQKSYYLEITLTRATTATNPRFNRLQLQ
jgi:peptidoglycan hydrolase-like protein with peptidoglycan-binding domain